MKCDCFCKHDSTSKRGKTEDTCCASDSIVSIRMFLFVLFFLCVVVMLNLLTTNAHLSSIAKVATHLRNSMNQFIKEKHLILKTFYEQKTSEKVNVPDIRKKEHTSNPLVTTTSRNVETKATKISKKPTVRPDTCKSCFQHNFKYLIDNPSICNTGGGKQEKIDIIIFIFTTHNRRLHRDTIRKTWISDAKNNTSNIRYAFLLGYTNNKDDQAAVEKENEEFHDILQEDFVDAYLNLTYKTMMAFKWAVTKCEHARFIMKTDDDMYVNTIGLLSVANQAESSLKKNVGGACQRVAGPIRDRTSKWYASVESYPGKSYPGFCSGTGYVTSIAMARKVFDISKNVPFFHLEDVYVALCVRKLKLSLLPIRGFNAGQVRPHGCNYKKNSLITSHYMNPDLVKKIWALKC